MTAPGPAPGVGGPTGAGRPAAGDLADEAAQLLDALSVRLHQVRITVGTHESVVSTPVADAPGEADDEPAAGHVRCVGWCPVCRGADLLRGERPEVAVKLVDSAIVVIGALRSLLPATPAGAAPAAGPSGDSEPPQPGVERIDIR